MARTATPSCTASDAIADQIAWIDNAPIPDAVHAVMALAGTVDGARTDVVDAKTRLIRKACGDGYSVRKVAEMMGVSPGYVQRLKTQRGPEPIEKGKKGGGHKDQSMRGGPERVSKKPSAAASLARGVGVQDGLAPSAPQGR